MQQSHDPDLLPERRASVICMASYPPRWHCEQQQKPPSPQSLPSRESELQVGVVKFLPWIAFTGPSEPGKIQA